MMTILFLFSFWARFVYLLSKYNSSFFRLSNLSWVIRFWRICEFVCFFRLFSKSLNENYFIFSSFRFCSLLFCCCRWNLCCVSYHTHVLSFVRMIRALVFAKFHWFAARSSQFTITHGGLFAHFLLISLLTHLQDSSGAYTLHTTQLDIVYRIYWRSWFE